jgi:hypothetical protein
MAAIVPSAKTVGRKAAPVAKAAPVKTAPKAAVAKVDVVEFTLPLDHNTPNCAVFGIDWKKDPKATVRTLYASLDVAEALSLGDKDSIVVSIRKA